MGIADNTIVLYSTDNGLHYNSLAGCWHHALSGEKNTNWEWSWRVPIFVRWPGKIKPGAVFNNIASHQDWLPALLAAAGDTDIVQKLLGSHQIAQKIYNVHIDGLNLLPYPTGQTKESPRKFFLY